MPRDLVPTTEALSKIDRDPIVRCLTEARALLAAGWCRNALARDGRGRSVRWDSTDATSFCIGGAINRAGLEHPRGQAGAMLMLAEVLGHPVSTVNDGLTGKDEAIAILDRAIEHRRAMLVRRGWA